MQEQTGWGIIILLLVGMFIMAFFFKVLPKKQGL
jgi:F0F1-type ATP synthase assembly protein I